MLGPIDRCDVRMFLKHMRKNSSRKPELSYQKTDTTPQQIGQGRDQCYLEVVWL